MKNYSLEHNTKKTVEKLTASLSLLNNPPETVEQWATFIDNIKDEILSLSSKQNFALPQFQDCKGLIDKEGFTFRSIGLEAPNGVTLEADSQLRKSGIPNLYSRGIFFPIGSYLLWLDQTESKTAKFIGFDEKGKWLKYELSYEAYSCEERLKKSDDYNVRYINGTPHLSIARTSITEILSEATESQQGNNKIGRAGYDILLKLRSYMDELVDRLKSKHSIAQDFLQTMLIKEELLMKKVFE